MSLRDGRADYVAAVTARMPRCLSSQHDTLMARAATAPRRQATNAIAYYRLLMSFYCAPLLFYREARTRNEEPPAHAIAISNVTIFADFGRSLLAHFQRHAKLASTSHGSLSIYERREEVTLKRCRHADRGRLLSCDGLRSKRKA